MGKVGLSGINPFCRSCQITLGGKVYNIMGVMSLSPMGVLMVAYYVSRTDKPEMALLCYHTQGKALGMSAELADLRVMADVRNYGSEMVERYEKEVLSYRKDKV